MVFGLCCGCEDEPSSLPSSSSVSSLSFSFDEYSCADGECIDGAVPLRWSVTIPNSWLSFPNPLTCACMMSSYGGTFVLHQQTSPSFDGCVWVSSEFEPAYHKYSPLTISTFFCADLTGPKVRFSVGDISIGRTHNFILEFYHTIYAGFNPPGGGGSTTNRFTSKWVADTGGSPINCLTSISLAYYSTSRSGSGSEVSCITPDAGFQAAGVTVVPA